LNPASTKARKVMYPSAKAYAGGWCTGGSTGRSHDGPAEEVAVMTGPTDLVATAARAARVFLLCYPVAARGEEQKDKLLLPSPSSPYFCSHMGGRVRASLALPRSQRFQSRDFR
jgi:hypothetical protein